MDVEKLIREYLPQVIHLSLGTSMDNKPWVCEVHFAYDKNLNLYYRSLTSRRHSQEIAENPNVAGNIIKQHAVGESVIGVYFEGTSRLLSPGHEQNIAFECVKSRLQTDDSILEEARSPNGHQFYKIAVSKWYIFGPFNGKPSQKYELSWS
jgi:uncharacterized protein YhbP (UPF0306 family)